MADDSRLWRVPIDEETGEVNLGIFGETLEEVGALLRRAGGAVRMNARRRKDEQGFYVTEHIDVMWTLHAPLPRRTRPAPAPEPLEDVEGEVVDPDELELEPAAVVDGD